MKKWLRIASFVSILLVVCAVALGYYVSAFGGLTHWKGEALKEHLRYSKVNVSIPDYAEDARYAAGGFTDVSEYATYVVPQAYIAELSLRFKDAKTYQRGDHLDFHWNVKNELWDLDDVNEGLYIESRNSFTLLDVETRRVYTSYYTW